MIEKHERRIVRAEATLLRIPIFALAVKGLGCLDGFEFRHAIKRGEKKGMTQENRVVVITFDKSDKVSSIEVKPEYTGP